MSRYFLYGEDVIQNIPGTNYDIQMYSTSQNTPDRRFMALDVEYDPNRELTISYGGNVLYQRGSGNIDYNDIDHLKYVLKSADPTYYNKCLSLIDPSHVVHFLSPELRQSIEESTGVVDRRNNGYHLSTIQGVKELHIRTNWGLNEFAKNAQLFQSLEKLDIDISPEFMEPPVTDVLVVPDNVKSLRISNAMLKTLDISYASLTDIYLEDNHLMTGIYGLENQYDMETIRVSRARYIDDFDFHDLREQNPAATIWINLEDLGRIGNVKEILSDPENVLYEMNSYETVVYDSRDIWVQMDKTTDQWIKDNISQDMSKTEKVAAVHRYFTEDIAYPDKDHMGFIEEHSSANAIMLGLGVCESQCKAMQYTLSKLGIEAELVDCTMGLLTPQEIADIQNHETKPRFITQFRDSSNGMILGEGPNHAILRARFGDNWLYFDPTNDHNLDIRNSDSALSPLSFRSQKALSEYTYTDEHGNTCGYRLSQCEQEIPSRRDVPRHIVRALYLGAEEKQPSKEQKEPEKKRHIPFHRHKKEIETQKKPFEMPTAYADSTQKTTIFKYRSRDILDDSGKDYSYERPAYLVCDAIPLYKEVQGYLKREEEFHPSVHDPDRSIQKEKEQIRDDWQR